MVPRKHRPVFVVALLVLAALGAATGSGDDRQPSGDAAGQSGAAATTPTPSEPAPAAPKPAPTPAPATGTPSVLRGARVVRIVDGDTLHAEHQGRAWKVRLIGIDTPESNTARFGHPECGGAEATLAAKDLQRRWPAVTLETDPTQDRVDRYGRLLAYVVPETEPDTTYQEELLRLGWAQVYVYGGKAFTQVDRFRAAARAGEQRGDGVWSRCAGDFRRAIDR